MVVAEQLAVRRAASWRYTLIPAAFIIFTVLLQRIGVSVGDQKIMLCVPIMLPLLLLACGLGIARINQETAFPFVVFMISILISSVVNFASPSNDVSLSPTALALLFINYVVFLFSPATVAQRKTGWDLLVGMLRTIAVLAIVEYLIQFVGIRLFSFHDLLGLPREMLLEGGGIYNTVIPLEYGSGTFKSNGLVLLEPSFLSQFMGLAIILEVFYNKDYKWLLVYAGAYLFSYSGTGLLCLILTFAICGVVADGHRLKILTAVAGFILLAGVMSVALPDIFVRFAGRAGELGDSRTSGYIRYTSQAVLMNEFMESGRVVFGFGPGSAGRLSTQDIVGTSAVLKILFEYGIFGLLAFGFLFYRAMFANKMLPVSVYAAMWFQFGGEYFACTVIVYFLLFVCTWCQPPDQAAATGAKRRLPGARRTLAVNSWR